MLSRPRVPADTSAATAGVLPSLIRDVWEVVEGGGEGGEGRRDHRLVAPWTHPLDPMDHTLHKVRGGGE